MKTILQLLLLLSLSTAYAQKINLCSDCTSHPLDKKNCKSFFGKIALAQGISVEDYLQENIKNLHTSSSQLNIGIKQTNYVKSLTGKHFTYIQTLNGIAIFRSQIKVNMDDKGNILSVFDNSVLIKRNVNLSTIPDSNAAKQAIQSQFANWELKADYIWYNDETNLIKITHFYAKNFATSQYRELIVNNKGNILYNKDLNRYYSNPDTNVVASIFLPDPLTSAGVVYGAPYKNYNDSNVAVLDSQMVKVKMGVSLVNDTFRLESPFAAIAEFSSPVTIPAYSLTPYFNYNRSQVEFEDVNSFYHVNIIQKHIQTLGFTNIVNYQMLIDAHANNYSDNSQFSSMYPPGRLYFGQGGVDDAEDMDVIAHEYGHAISESAAPNSNFGNEREALDEANSDYFASSYSRFLNAYHWDWVFTWDGHNEYWPGRFTTSTKHYPEDLVYNLYTDADIWSSTIMQLWGDIGRDTCDKILIESIYGYANNMTMRNAAYLFLNADSALTGGKNSVIITKRMTDRGLFACWD
jgi:hypothetical protein